MSAQLRDRLQCSHVSGCIVNTYTLKWSRISLFIAPLSQDLNILGKPRNSIQPQQPHSQLCCVAVTAYYQVVNMLAMGCIQSFNASINVSTSMAVNPSLDLTSEYSVFILYGFISL